MLSPQRLCLSSQSHLSTLLPCDIRDPAQQWAWLPGARLVHTQSSRCLWAGAGLQLSARPVQLGGCGEAPAWGCSGADGAFGLADARWHLRRHKARLAAGGEAQTPAWRKLDVDSGGNAWMTSLCPDSGERRPHQDRCAGVSGGVTSNPNRQGGDPRFTYTNCFTSIPYSLNITDLYANMFHKL